MKIGYFGSPQISQELLRSLYESGEHEIVCVVSNADRRKGRSGKLHPTEVSLFASEAGLPVYKYESLKKDGQADPEIIKELGRHKPDLFVIFAYGKIIPKEIFTIPRLGSINLHASLLPALRGASPIQSALIAGFSKTGWSIQFLTERMDAGDILSACELPVDPDETAGELTERMLPPGIQLMQDCLQDLKRLAAEARPQDETKATYCSKLRTEDSWLDWSKPTRVLHNQIRGMNPAPGARSLLSGTPLKIWRSRVLEQIPDSWKDLAAGSFAPLPDRKGALGVRTGDGCLEILELQPQGRKQLTARDFLNGYRSEGPVLLSFPPKTDD